MSSAPARDSFKIIASLLAPLKGRRILDIGCGRGDLLQALAEQGARVAGIDPDPAAIEMARRTAPGAFLKLATAEHIPFGDGLVHAAVFLNSLHHVPVSGMPAALAEAARVVGKGGMVLIVEPLTEGTFFEAMRPIEDETQVRLAAQAAIDGVVRSGMLSEVSRLDYERVETFTSVAVFIDRVVAGDPVRKDKALDEREKVMKRFDTLAERNLKGYALRQPLRLRQLKVPA